MSRTAFLPENHPVLTPFNVRKISSYEELYSTRPSSSNPADHEKWVRFVFHPIHTKWVTAGNKHQRASDDDCPQHGNLKRPRLAQESLSQEYDQEKWISSAIDNATLPAAPTQHQFHTDSSAEQIFPLEPKTSSARSRGAKVRKTRAPRQGRIKLQNLSPLRDDKEIRRRLGLGEFLKDGPDTTIAELCQEYGAKNNAAVRSAAKQALVKHYGDTEAGIFWPTEWIKQQFMILRKTMTPKSHLDSTDKVSHIPQLIVDQKVAMGECFAHWRIEKHREGVTNAQMHQIIRNSPSLMPLIPDSSEFQQKLQPQIDLLREYHPWFTQDLQSSTTASKKEPSDTLSSELLSPGTAQYNFFEAQDPNALAPFMPVNDPYASSRNLFE